MAISTKTPTPEGWLFKLDARGSRTRHKQILSPFAAVQAVNKSLTRPQQPTRRFFVAAAFRAFSRPPADNLPGGIF